MFIFHFFTHLTLWGHGRSYIMRIERSTRDSMYQLDVIAVSYWVHVIDSQIGFIRSLYNPPIVDIFEAVACDLLLMTGASFVRIADWVNVGMGVQPAGTTKGVTQCYLRALSYDKRLTFCD